MNESIRKYMAELGRKGGASKSEKKRETARINVSKAREKRKNKLDESIDKQ